MRATLLLTYCTTLLATLGVCVRAEPTFGNEYVHIRLKVPKVAAKNAHDNLHKLENAGKQHKQSHHHQHHHQHNQQHHSHQQHHGGAPAVVHHHHHHHHTPSSTASATVHAATHHSAPHRPTQHHQHHQHHGSYHDHHSHHHDHHDHTHHHNRDHHHHHNRKPQHHSHHPHHHHHRDPDHILDSVLVSQLKEVSGIDSDHVEYLNHAHDIANHLTASSAAASSASSSSYQPHQYVETFHVVEAKPEHQQHHAHGYSYNHPTSSSGEPHHSHHSHDTYHSQGHYHTTSSAAIAASVAPNHDYLPPPSTTAPQQHHSYQPSYPPSSATHHDDGYGAPAAITPLDDVADSYLPQYSELRSPSPRPVYGPPSFSVTSTKQPSYAAAYAPSSHPTFASYQKPTSAYIPPAPSTHTPTDYQGYDQLNQYATATKPFKPSPLYHGYEALEGNSPTGYQQLSDGYLPPETLTPPANGGGYSNSYEDQTLAGLGEGDEDGIDAGGGGGQGGYHASETYTGIDSYSAAHVQGVGSGGYAYGGPYT